MITCPICGTVVDKRVGVVIGGVWRYCWLCERCGERWGWVVQEPSLTTDFAMWNAASDDALLEFEQLLDSQTATASEPVMIPGPKVKGE